MEPCFIDAECYRIGHCRFGSWAPAGYEFVAASAGPGGALFGSGRGFAYRQIEAISSEISCSSYFEQCGVSFFRLTDNMVNQSIDYMFFSICNLQ